MKNVLLIILVSVFSFSSYANDGNKKEKLKTYSITGKVTDNQEGLTGVNVIIDNVQTKIYTDFDGNFTIDNVIEGTHTLSFDIITYENKTIQINTNDKTDVTVEMSGR